MPYVVLLSSKIAEHGHSDTVKGGRGSAVTGPLSLVESEPRRKKPSIGGPDGPLARWAEGTRCNIPGGGRGRGLNCVSPILVKASPSLCCGQRGRLHPRLAASLSHSRVWRGWRTRHLCRRRLPVVYSPPGPSSRIESPPAALRPCSEASIPSGRLLTRRTEH